MGSILTIASAKGGCGKSALTTVLASPDGRSGFCGLPTLAQHLSDLIDFRKFTVSGLVPGTGKIVDQAIAIVRTRRIERIEPQLQREASWHRGFHTLDHVGGAHEGQGVALHLGEHLIHLTHLEGARCGAAVEQRRGAQAGRMPGART